MSEPQRMTIAELIAAAPAYGDTLRNSYTLDRSDETIRRARESLYATLAYLIAVDADGQLHRRRQRRAKPKP